MHCTGKTGAHQKGKDPPLRRTVAVVFLSVAPSHSVQGRFARSNGNRSRSCVYLAGMFSLPSVDQAQRVADTMTTEMLTRIFSRRESDAYRWSSRRLSALRFGFIGSPVSGNRGAAAMQLGKQNPSTCAESINGPFLCFSAGPEKIRCAWSELGLRSKEYRIRDLWKGHDIGAASMVDLSLPAHGCALSRLSLP